MHLPEVSWMSHSLWRSQVRLAATAAAAALVSCSATNPNPNGIANNRNLFNEIQHVVVIYQENQSFDGLYGYFRGANGLSNATAAQIGQVDKFTGAAIATLP